MEESHRKFTVMGGLLKHDVCDYITAMTSESEVQTACRLYSMQVRTEQNSY